MPDSAVAAAQEIYRKNMFPHIRVRWDRYPDNRGHLLHPGCFRCHGADLETGDGTTISKDCDLCRTIVFQGLVGGEPDSLTTRNKVFHHPVDIDGAETEVPCYECHAGDDSLY